MTARSGAHTVLRRMPRVVRTGLCALVLMVIATACGSKKTIIHGSTGGEFPNNGFPLTAEVKHHLDSNDPPLDWQGIHLKGPTDILKAEVSSIVIDGNALEKLQTDIRCGPSADSLVVCPPSNPALEGGPYLYLWMKMNSAIPHQPLPGEFVHYSVFIDAGGDPATKAVATPDAPDRADQGTNMDYQVAIGQPATPANPAGTASIELTAFDHRKGGASIDTTARAILHGPYVTWIIPLAELGNQVTGVREGASWASATQPGNTKLRGQDVVPGSKHAPFGLFNIPQSWLQTSSAKPSSPNVVVASCQQLNVSPGSTDVVEEFIPRDLVPGQYKVTLTTGAGELSGSTTLAPGATFVEVPTHFTQFTTINRIQIDGPKGTIAPGTFESQFPFVLNAASDHATDCDGSKLKAPSASAGPTADVAAQIKTFLADLATATHTAAGVENLVATLNRAVVDRYGLDQCRSFLNTTIDPTADFSVVDITGPSPFDYTGDGQTTTVQDVFQVQVRRTQNGQTADATIHIARNSDGTFSWFTRCKSG
jgi:hypothetical protein